MSSTLRTSVPARPPNTDADAASRALLRLIAFTIGMYPPLSGFMGRVRVGPVSVVFALIALTAAIGWWWGSHDPNVRRYLKWAALFAVAVTISAFAAGGSTPGRSIDASSWALVFIPGLAVVFSHRDLRRAALMGFVIGAGFFLLVSMYRVAAGQSIIDTNNLHADRRSLLGLNRYGVDLVVVFGVPFMVVKNALNIPRLFRYFYLVAAVVWISASQGRTGAIGLVLAPVVVAVLAIDPHARSQAKRLALLALAGGLVYVGLTSVSIAGFGAVDRLQRAASGDYTTSDQARVMLLRKAWHLAWDQPLTGVGWGNTPTAYHPVIEEARNLRIRHEALVAHPHNHYLEIWSDTGTFGLLGWVGALSAPLLAGIRKSRFPEVRAATSAYIVMLLIIAFHSSFGSDQFIAIALLLGAVADPEYSLEPDLPVPA